MTKWVHGCIKRSKILVVRLFCLYICISKQSETALFFGSMRVRTTVPAFSDDRSVSFVEETGPTYPPAIAA